MDRERHLRNYDLHSWSGIALGLFLYVVAFSGCLALFHAEIQSWEDPAKRLTIADNPLPIDATLKAWLTEEAGNDRIEFLRIDFPNLYEPYYKARLRAVDPENNSRDHMQRWDTETGIPLPKRGEGLSAWLVGFHIDLMWPDILGGRTVGRPIVGIAGIIMMLSILTGVVAHTKIFRQLFTLRHMRSIRLKWQDTHKVLGLWGLPFYSMISFTGAFLGVVALLAPIIAILAFKGDQEALIEAAIGPRLEPAGITAEMISVDQIAALRHFESGYAPAWAVITNWGDQNARIDVYFEADTELAQVDGIQIDGVTGERIMNSQFENITLPIRLTNAISPLHFGTYGGVALKILYFILGLSLAVVTALGLMIWVERRLHGAVGRKSPDFYRFLSHLIVGVTVGLPLANVMIFYLDKLYLGAESARLYWTGTVFFFSWAGAIIYAFMRHHDYRAVRELLLGTGILLSALPFVNFIQTDAIFWAILDNAHPVTGFVDIGLFSIGTLTSFVALKLPKDRVHDINNQAIVQPTENLSPTAAE